MAQRTFQVFFIDKYTECKKITHRVTTTKTMEEWLNTYGRRHGFYRYNHTDSKFELVDGYEVEEV